MIYVGIIIQAHQNQAKKVFSWIEVIKILFVFQTTNIWSAKQPNEQVTNDTKSDLMVSKKVFKTVISIENRV